KFKLSCKTVPKLVVPDLIGFQLRLYVLDHAPAGSEPPLTACNLFQEFVAPSIRKDFQEGIFDAEKLETCGFKPSQEGKLFKLFSKNFMRQEEGKSHRLSLVSLEEQKELSSHSMMRSRFLLLCDSERGPSLDG
ncbi:UNVERIFIED_CONTAM: 39S ribosomal protein L41, mitochondrial, partial [Gekko kuhli]